MNHIPRHLKQQLASGKKLIMGWCAIPSTITAEVIASMPFDVIAVDLQHGFIDYERALSMIQVIDSRGHPVLARVPWNDPGIIMKLLDAGYTGIICPMINTADDAQKFVAACRYAPVGQRSWGPARALNIFGADYGTTANERVTTFAMIETVQAVQNLEEILAVDGVDAIYIGPSDLGLSMGFTPTLEPTELSVLEAITHILNSALRAGKYAAIHCGSPEMVQRMLEQGFNLATLMTDARIFTAAISSKLSEARNKDMPNAVNGSQY